MPPPEPTPVSGPLFTEADFDHALDVLDLLLQDQDLPTGEIKFKQSELINALRERGITVALAKALVENLITRRVFREGKTFYHLHDLTRLDGVTLPGSHQKDRYLHTTREEWYSYLATRTGDGPLPSKEPERLSCNQQLSDQAADFLLDYVTLDQMAAVIHRSKRTLEKWKTREKNPLPAPDVEGGGGKADEWLWSAVRPWLEAEYGRKLPEQYPGGRIRDC
jgi:hypothetical protein